LNLFNENKKYDKNIFSLVPSPLRGSVRNILHLLLLISFVANAQQKDRILPKANAEYAENKFVEAEANYRISDSKFPNKATAPFNLGNTIYKQTIFQQICIC
jgi:hypothetical protein